MSELTRTTLAIDLGLLEKFDAWLAGHGYTNRSEAMRDLIHGALTESKWDNPRAKVAATLSVIYDHGERALAQRVTHLQHADHHAVLCSQHIHLDHDRCLEVIIMRGTAAQLRRLADNIISTRGVRAGKLTLMSTNL
ncbi:MAG: nickel-responsive transcriptional regulator NikR [Planctomycetota bacterium]|nr:nickel-responsive transcriptional regulator NikR [Planctomycetota bacterium]